MILVHAVPRSRASGSSDAPLDERELVELARSDALAFGELYRRYVRRIYGFAYKRTGSAAMSEDITSATFERALRGLAGFQWRSGGFEGWLFRIASNEIVDSYRSKARAESERGQRAMGALAAVAQVDEFCDPASRELVRAALGTLNDRYQRALDLKYFAGLSPDEAAKAMGQPKAVFAVTVHRATAALRRAIERQGVGE